MHEHHNESPRAPIVRRAARRAPQVLPSTACSHRCAARASRFQKCACKSTDWIRRKRGNTRNDNSQARCSGLSEMEISAEREPLQQPSGFSDAAQSVLDHHSSSMGMPQCCPCEHALTKHSRLARHSGTSQCPSRSSHVRLHSRRNASIAQCSRATLPTQGPTRTKKKNEPQHMLRQDTIRSTSLQTLL